MRKMMLTMIVLMMPVGAHAAPPVVPGGELGGVGDNYIACVRNHAMKLGLEHKEVAALDVVGAAATQCENGDPVVAHSVPWKTVVTTMALDAGAWTPEGHAVIEERALRWREENFKELAAQLTAKRLGL